jgi:serine carboxypeptidase-like clade 2
MYSGYIQVNETNDRNIFYWFIEAENNIKSAPLYVWFQGGPGCSGLGGLFTENGPLSIVNGNPTYRNLGWTQFASMLYIEQPACVGFSYTANCLENNATGDYQAAGDNYAFLQMWLQLPEFAAYVGRPTYFGGESYGGVYVPMLTELVLSDSSTQIYSQFAGFLIVNPVMSCQGGFIGTTGAYNMEEFNLLYWHGMVSYENYYNWTKYNCNVAQNAGQPDCEYILNLAVSQVGVIQQALQKRTTTTTNPAKQWPSLNPDAIYFDWCLGNGSLSFSTEPNQPGTCNSFNVDSEVTAYLNRPDVQAAIGARPPQTPWSECANINYNISGINMVPLYDEFVNQKADISILVYSGDVDIMTVPFAYTVPCFEQMTDKGAQLRQWGPWFVNHATAGYWQQYTKYSFATVKGAGHEAPEYQQLNAFHMVERFLSDGSLIGDEPPAPTIRPKHIRQSDVLRKYGLAKRVPWLQDVEYP